MPTVIRKGYTFDDLLLVPQASNILPKDVVLKTKIADSINLNIPVMSAAMDTVTDHKMAIAMADLGGLGIIHKNLSLVEQAQEVVLVKQTAVDLSLNPLAALDSKNKLLVGAAVGIANDTLSRVATLVKYGVDVICLDTAHGHSKYVIEVLRKIKKNFKLPVIAGNIATAKAAADLIAQGADCLKVGIGPGSICTTRIVSGVGVPQLTAIMDVTNVAAKHNIPVIADGGIKQSGDITKALAAGAQAVMLGSLLAGTDEAPGELVEFENRLYKTYRGMGSAAAMAAGSSDRYFQKDAMKYVPEGIEGFKEAIGPLSEVLFKLVGGLRSGMAYCGARTISELHHNSEFIEQSAAGLYESLPHDVIPAK
ncbi:IMP dehydrogenase [[Mycoplasma] testudinis]|uniref:IMP dehydrogenase n=1 Tax=[Mycoplasma] testudinis TaxID=33924 RepID=UPI000564E213|nr:IMP dehydrogenase [[Mycoplasma] testudinis]